MGTWSYPLFATVDAGSPDDYVIDITTMSETEIAHWRHAAFLGDESKTRWTLTEFMNTRCDTHKIIDHMGREQIMRWEGLFRQLYTAYPSLTRLAFHFFTSDGGFPYCLTMDRGTDAKLLLCCGHSESFKYFRPRWSWPWTPENLRAPAEFLPENYRRAYVMGGLDMNCLRLDSSRMLW